MTHATSEENSADMKSEQNNNIFKTGSPLKNQMTQPQVNFDCPYTKKVFFNKDVLLDRIKYEYLFYCSNLVAND